MSGLEGVSERLRPHADTFEDFYRSSYRRAIHLAVLLGVSRDQADDLVQDAFVGMCRRWSSIESPDEYLNSSIRNGMRSALRRGYRGDAGRRFVHDGLPDQVDDAIPFEDDELAGALEQLAPKHREVLVCRFFLDMSERDVARLIDRPVGTVKSRMSRALALLERRLARG